MKRSKFSEEQIVRIIKEVEAGTKAIMPSVGEVCLWHREPTPLQRALVRGHDWLALLEAGS